MNKVYFWYESDGEGGDQVGRIFTDKEKAITEYIKERGGTYIKQFTEENQRSMASRWIGERELE